MKKDKGREWEINGSDCDSLENLGVYWLFYNACIVIALDLIGCV